jgi:FKBP-type peptidyl-prolyl cis-trans isomerase
MRGRFLLPLFAVVPMLIAISGCNSTPRLNHLEKTDLTVGKGEGAKSGDFVYVHYRGWLEDGTEFDSNGEGKDPYSFVLGKASVIPGWDQGIVGMKEGGKRRLKIPPELGYGSQGNDKIPGNAVLNFDIEMVRVVPASDANTVTVRIITPGHGNACKVGDKVTISYVAKSMAGAKIDSSDDHGGLVTFHAGKDELTSRGLDSGIIGMKEGEVREVALPPNMSIAPAAEMRNPGLQLVTVTMKRIG